MSSAPVPATTVRARWSLMAMFGVFGVLPTSWMSRLPSVRSALHVTSGQLGLLLTLGAIGALLAVVCAGAIVTRFGSRATLGAVTALTLIGFLFQAYGAATAGVAMFGVGTFLGGVCGALVNVPINLNAARVEQQIGRAILPHFHAAYSIGAGVGSLIGAGCSRAGIPIALQLAVVPAAITAIRVFLVRPSTALEREHSRPPVDARADPARGHGAGAGAARADRIEAASPPDTPPAPIRRRQRGSVLAAWLEPRTLLIGVVLLASSLSEGGAGTWLSAAVHDGFPVSEATGALVYSTFVAAQTVFRFAGTRLIDRFGRVPILRASIVSAIVGLLLFGLGPSLAFAWAGAVLWGCGSALGNPICISAASDDPRRAPARVSVVASFTSIASLCGPPVLGLLVDSLGGERHALLTICAVALVGLAFSGAVRPLRAGDRERFSEATRPA